MICMHKLREILAMQQLFERNSWTNLILSDTLFTSYDFLPALFSSRASPAGDLVVTNEREFAANF